MKGDAHSNGEFAGKNIIFGNINANAIREISAIWHTIFLFSSSV
jgi:hypothetical protein